MGYCVGNIVGPQTFKSKQAPKYTGGVVAMLVCYGAALFLIALYRLASNVGQDRDEQSMGQLTSQYLVLLNRRKVKKRTECETSHGVVGLLDEWQDQTDLENPRFIYEL